MFTAEVISIGAEILNGSTLNTNAAFISSQLTELGFRVQRQTSTPDNQEIILETVSESLACSPLVIITGGLGPTVDDLTREAIANLMETPLEINETLLHQLQEQFGPIDSIENQATQPKGALLLKNLSGTASGLVFVKGSSVLIVLPGVPLEMELMMKNEVLPYLKKIFPHLTKSTREKLHFFEVYESSVDPLLRKVQAQFPDLTIGIYPNHGLVSINLEGAFRDVHLAKEAILKEFGEKSYESQDGTIETAIQELFIQNNWTLSLAESCTGGAIAAKLTKIPGASQYLLGSLVVYSNSLKEQILDLPSSLLQEKGAVSKEVAEALATNLQQKSKSTFSLAVTGIAGPTGGSNSKPVGTIFLGLKKEGENAKSIQLQAKGERQAIIERSVNFALGSLYCYCLGRKGLDMLLT